MTKARFIQLWPGNRSSQMLQPWDRMGHKCQTSPGW